MYGKEIIKAANYSVGAGRMLVHRIYHSVYPVYLV